MKKTNSHVDLVEFPLLVPKRRKKLLTSQLSFVVARVQLYHRRVVCLVGFAFEKGLGRRRRVVTRIVRLIQVRIQFGFAAPYRSLHRVSVAHLGVVVDEVLVLHVHSALNQRQLLRVYLVAFRRSTDVFTDLILVDFGQPLMRLPTQLFNARLFG